MQTTRVQLTYNPFTVESHLFINDDEQLNSNSNLHSQLYGHRMSEWLENFFHKLYEEIGSYQFSLTFKGLWSDFEALQYQAQQLGLPVELRFVGDKEISFASRFESARALVGFAKENMAEVFEQDSARQQRLAELIKADFAVNVIATMSSGKSTLINALLGQDLLPAKNAACTASIIRLIDHPHQAQITGERRDAQRQSLEYHPDVDKKLIEAWNMDEDTHFIDIHLPIGSRTGNEQVRLVIIDTPGPNNASDATHAKIMESVLANDALSMVLYVINATQMSTEDDQRLLTAVKTAIAQGGRQLLDRFVFLVNKIDGLDLEEGENIEETLTSAKRYLQSNGIETNRIFPISAEWAKLARMSLAGHNLSSKQRDSFDSAKRRVLNEPEWQLNQYGLAGVSAGVRLSVAQALASCGDDPAKLVAYHSGLPLIEALMQEYLEHHTLVSKVTDIIAELRHFSQQATELTGVNASIQQAEQKIHDYQQALQTIKTTLPQYLRQNQLTEALEVQTEAFSKAFEQELAKVQTRLQKSAESLVEKLTGNEAEAIKLDDLQPELSAFEHSYQQAIEHIALWVETQGKQALASMTQATQALPSFDVSMVEELNVRDFASDQEIEEEEEIPDFEAYMKSKEFKKLIKSAQQEAKHRERAYGLHPFVLMNIKIRPKYDEGYKYYELILCDWDDEFRVYGSDKMTKDDLDPASKKDVKIKNTLLFVTDDIYDDDDYNLDLYHYSFFKLHKKTYPCVTDKAAFQHAITNYDTLTSQLTQAFEQYITLWRGQFGIALQQQTAQLPQLETLLDDIENNVRQQVTLEHQIEKMKEKGAWFAQFEQKLTELVRV